MTEVEVITGRERRRRYSESEKRELVAKTLEPGVNVSAIARSHGVAPNLLFQWRKKYRQASSEETQSTELAPTASPFVRVSSPAPTPDAGEIKVHINEEILIEFPAATEPARIKEIVQGLRG